MISGESGRLREPGIVGRRSCERVTALRGRVACLHHEAKIRFMAMQCAPASPPSILPRADGMCSARAAAVVDCAEADPRCG